MIRALLAAALGVCSSIAIAADFRGTSWGATPEDVIAQEGTPLGQKPDLLMYRGSVANLPVAILYEFDSQGLVSGFYSLTTSYTNKNLHLRDYDNLKGLLTEKYGPPQSDDKVWRNNLYRDDPAGWGTAVSIGHLVLQSVWETDRTEISLTLTGNNYEINHGIIYRDREAIERVEARKRNQAKGAL